MSKPTIHYFNLRGRAEVMRLAFSLKGVDFTMVPVDYAAMKSDSAAYPFGQCPRWVLLGRLVNPVGVGEVE